MYHDTECLLPSKKPKLSMTVEQFIVLLLIMLPAITPGMTVGFAAIALPEISNLTLTESSWFASIPTIGSVLGNLLAGYLIDRYGRRKTFLLTTLNSIIGCVLLSGPQVLLYLYSGQFFTGIAQGSATLAPTVYIAESIVPNNLHLRSSMTTWNVLAFNTGICIVYVLGSLFHYTTVALIGAGIAVVAAICLLLFIPESPSWLRHKGRYKEAEIAEYRLGFRKRVNHDDNIPPKYLPIDEDDYKENFSEYFSNIRRKDVYKPLILTITFFFFQQFSGIQVFTAYMVDLLTVKSIDISPYVLTVVTGLIVIFTQLLFTCILPHKGIRKMSMLSVIGVGISNLILGLCLSVNDTQDWYSPYVDYIHVLVVWMNVFFGQMGISTLPYSLIGELFPKDVKGFAAIPVFCVSSFYFINLMIYPFALVYAGNAIYFAYSSVSFLTLIFIYFCLPETVGRTLDEISNNFLHS